MTNVLPLVFRAASAGPPPGLRQSAVMPLPIAVSTAAWAVADGDYLRLIINEPGLGSSTHLRIDGALRLEPLPPIGIVVAGVVTCDMALVLTGSDRDGRPVAIGVAPDGAETWRTHIPEPVSTRWPVPLCPGRAVVVWQPMPGRLDVANVGPGGLTRRRSLSVGRPTVEVAAAAGRIWSVWVEPGGVRGLVASDDAERAIQLSVGRPGTVCAGSCNEGPCVAWEEDGRAAFARMTAGGDLAEDPTAVEVGEASGGRMAIVTTPSPIIWAQRVLTDDVGPPTWISALAVPGEGTLIVEGPTHAATGWRNQLVLVGTQSLHLLDVGGDSP